MHPKKVLSSSSRNIVLTLVMLVIVAITFSLYIYAEKQVDRASDIRLKSFMLADELRQSSDDLTRMVRSYVVTGDPIYKQHYQEILDIRDGKKPRPVGYNGIYWDLVLGDDQRPSPDGQVVPLLTLMKQAGFREAELAKLAQAKANSDALTRPELAAMALVESTTPTTEAKRIKAIQMLNDASYHRAKYGIMRPISEFHRMMDQRTLDAVNAAENMAMLLRVVVILFGLLLAFALWRVYRALYNTLGCPVDELQECITRLGGGDFSSAIPVPSGMKNSVLGWLSETQINLARIDTERRQAENLLRESEDRFKTMFNKAPLGIALIDSLTGHIYEINPKFAKIAGRSMEQMANIDWMSITHPDDVQADLDNMALLNSGRITGFQMEKRYLHPDGTAVWISMTIASLEVEDKAHPRHLCMIEDITERKQSELRLNEALAETQRLREALDYVPAYIYMKDSQSRYVYASRPTLKLFGCSAEELVGCDDTRFFPPDTVKRLQEIDTRVFQGEQTDEEIDVPAAIGGRRIYWEFKSPIYADAAKRTIWGLLGISIDITDRKQMEEQIQNLAYFDSLTNLPNRRMLLDRLAHALADAKRYHRSLAIMFLDLDNFKNINDMLGHDAGDELLKEVSVRLNTCVRTGDTVSRQGGDEFIIVLTEITHPDDAALVADKIIKTINVPVQVADDTLNISTSIGIAVYPINGSDDAQELMKKADRAMYAAKAAGRNCYRFFTD